MHSEETCLFTLLALQSHIPYRPSHSSSSAHKTQHISAAPTHPPILPLLTRHTFACAGLKRDERPARTAHSQAFSHRFLCGSTHAISLHSSYFQFPSLTRKAYTSAHPLLCHDDIEPGFRMLALPTLLISMWDRRCHWA